MITAVTKGVKVSVETMFQPEQSNPANNHFMFAYKITIENQTDYAVQLISRNWEIYDSNGEFRTVAGQGVVGLQPIIPPAEAYEYVSGCNLETEMGKMKGSYDMRRVVDDFSFSVNIPEFQLVCPHRMN